MRDDQYVNNDFRCEQCGVLIGIVENETTAVNYKFTTSRNRTDRNSTCRSCCFSQLHDIFFSFVYTCSAVFTDKLIYRDWLVRQYSVYSRNSYSDKVSIDSSNITWIPNSMVGMVGTAGAKAQRPTTMTSRGNKRSYRSVGK